MTRGTSAKRSKTRTRSRQRNDAHSRIPKWNPATNSEKQGESASAHHAIAAAGGCQPCSNSAYCPKAEGVARRTSSESSI
ncbi:unnamed protein product, partial [Nippostrongylus brasiliensis]|uniref:Uncharacterized protein n=1 Tax=Nippostrongylus brasiliensis TaxID=27835 RepID=A0A0N4XMA1_NIPBR